MQRLMALLPWEQHLPQVVFLHNGANARLVASHGASFATVYVACSCPSCEKRPLAPFRTGGCVLGLGDWALHAGLKAASLAEIHVVQPGSEEKVPLAVWLQSNSLKIGGECLRRRQVNVFHWNGKLVPDTSDAVIKPGHRHITTTQLPSAYEGLGSWRAATIRGYDPSTCRFEVKYHDEPKRSQAHIWLPLAVLHFARNPPATEAAVRCLPEVASQPSATSFATAHHGPSSDIVHMSVTALQLHGVLRPQPCVYVQPLPPPTLPAPAAPAVLGGGTVLLPLPPPLQDRASVPLLGSFQSMPTAPASPQVSRQGSPQRLVFPDRDTSAVPVGSGDASPNCYLTFKAEEGPAPPPPLRKPQDCFASSTQLCGVVGEGGTVGGSGSGGGGGVTVGNRGAPAAPAAPPCVFLGCRLGSLLSLSAKSDSGSSNSTVGGGDASVGVSADGGSDGNGCGGCTTPISSKRTTPSSSKHGEIAIAVGGIAGGANPFGCSSWSQADAGMTGTTAPALLQQLPQPLHQAFPVCGGVWGPFTYCITSRGTNADGIAAAAAVGSGSGNSATATAATAPGAATVPAINGGAVTLIGPQSAMAPAPMPWAGCAASTSSTDDDLAALYAELCSEEASPADQLPTTKTYGRTTINNPPLPPPTVGPGAAAEAGNINCCTLPPPAVAVAAVLMKPGPPTKCDPDRDGSGVQIHPVLRAELLECQRHVLMMLPSPQPPTGAIASAQTLDHSILPTCLLLPTQQAQAAAVGTKRPRADGTTTGMAEAPPLLEAAAEAAMKPSDPMKSCGVGPSLVSQSALAAIFQDWDDQAPGGLLSTRFWEATGCEVTMAAKVTGERESAKRYRYVM